jgi:hypothetical protein
MRNTSWAAAPGHEVADEPAPVRELMNEFLSCAVHGYRTSRRWAAMFFIQTSQNPCEIRLAVGGREGQPAGATPGT